MPMLDRMFGLLGLSLDGVYLRQQALANNIANADTPGYRRFDVVLQEAASAFRGRTDAPRHLPIGGSAAPAYRLVEDRGTRGSINGNNVDLDYELVSLADNALRGETLVEIAGATLRRLTAVLREGR
ncbi:MAG: flagellar basal body rod protein FlgB [Hydrogenibacillus schlegelii]|uniref:Flagellar basal body rod protein FlgB n=1 Tax=Hydrogenibacillus schlegelii TaxID=1484 RepID=A0A947CZR9_HYDSH|nr:flagellar basal body rod protein FlgB [Hydrogenibacillus schlegelii]